MWKVGDIVANKGVSGPYTIGVIIDKERCVLTDKYGAATFPIKDLIPTPEIIQRWRIKKLKNILK